MVVDERNNEYELTDKGIQAWSEFQNGSGADDFTMLDLGHEYAVIDQNGSLNEQEKMTAKIGLRENDAKRKERSHNLRQMLRAHLLMEKDIDYIVQDHKIVIIDENTGRPAARTPLFRWPSPSDRSERRRRHPGRNANLCHDYAAKLLPHVRKALGHDRNGHDRGE